MVEGSFDVMFDDGGQLTGSFVAPACTPAGNSSGC
jgi:hypothetical protein